MDKIEPSEDAKCIAAATLAAAMLHAAIIGDHQRKSAADLYYDARVAIEQGNASFTH